MKHRYRHILAALCAVLLLCGPCLRAHAENAPVHLYLNIPFDTGTVEMVTQKLAEERNAVFEMNPNGVLTGNARNIEEYGYLFDAQIDFSDGNPQTAYSFETGEEFTRIPPAVERICLRTTLPTWRTLEDALPHIPGLMEQYIDMHRQLTEQYGQPDIRYFTTRTMNELRYQPFTFPDGQWHADVMQQIAQNDGLLVAYTYWGNVLLKLDVNLGIRYKGVYYADILLYYYPKNNIGAFWEKNTVKVYSMEGER